MTMTNDLAMCDMPVGYVSNHGRSHMSARLDGLQIAWDATSLAALLKCPRRYQYEHLCGWRRKSIHLEAGKYIASALERFQKARLVMPKEDALLEVMIWYMEESYADPSLGSYQSQWHCTAEKPRPVMVDGVKRYRKCPNALSGVWWPADDPNDIPAFCGECGEPIATERHFIPVDKAKNRLTIAAALLAYMDDAAETPKDGVFPYVFPNGTPAVELSFNVPWPSGRVAPTGESYSVCGHIDYLGVLGDEVFPSDNKTTGTFLGEKYFSGFSPSIQFDTYDLVASTLYPSLEIAGVQVDAIQISASGQAAGKRMFYKNDELREEHIRTLNWALDQAEQYAQRKYWPLNKANCAICPFREICSRPEGDREYAFESDETWERSEPWNPVITR